MAVVGAFTGVTTDIGIRFREVEAAGVEEDERVAADPTLNLESTLGLLVVGRGGDFLVALCLPPVFGREIGCLGTKKRC